MCEYELLAVGFSDRLTDQAKLAARDRGMSLEEWLAEAARRQIQYELCCQERT